MDTVLKTLDEVHALAKGVLEAHGCDAENAGAVADTMRAAERDGAKSHGLFRLPGHVALLKAGAVNGQARPAVEEVAPAALAVRGDDGFAPLALATGLPQLAERAKAQGVAVLALTRVVHYAALWPEAEALAADGLVAIACTSSPPYVAAAGGKRPVFGTNPMAFAWPRAGRAPMVWDQASAAMARGEVMLHAREGHAVPETAGIDAEGRPTTDPQAILDGGAQLPFGGYKGSAIALMVDLLAGPLLGEVTSLEAGASASIGGPQLGGELVLAIAPERLGGDMARAEGLFEALLSEEGVRLPGDRRLANRARTPAEGVAVPKKLMDEIAAL
ncbi:MAG: Ldh family oxidoreductase [Pseudomonadota bacterium]